MVRTLLRVALLIRWLSGGPMSARTPAMDLALACTHGRWIGEAQFAACVPCIAIALTRAEALAGALEKAARFVHHAFSSAHAPPCSVYEFDDCPGIECTESRERLTAWRARDEAGKE